MVRFGYNYRSLNIPPQYFGVEYVLLLTMDKTPFLLVEIWSEAYFYSLLVTLQIFANHLLIFVSLSKINTLLDDGVLHLNCTKIADSDSNLALSLEISRKAV